MLREIASFTVPFLLFACGAAPAPEPATPDSETSTDTASDMPASGDAATEGGG